MLSKPLSKMTEETERERLDRHLTAELSRATAMHDRSDFSECIDSLSNAIRLANKLADIKSDEERT